MRPGRFGLTLLVSGSGLMLVPLALGRNGFNKYLVAFALIGVCLGIAVLLHALIDRLTRRREG